MSDIYSELIVPIECAPADFPSIGSGFVFHRIRDIAYVVTCAHVMSDTDDSCQILVDDLPATVVAKGDPKGLDLAILEVRDLRASLDLTFQQSVQAGTPVKIWGFYKDSPTPYKKLQSIKAVFVEQVLVKGKKQQRGEAWNFDIISGELKPGYSGSPAINSNNEVVGIVFYSEGAKRGCAFGVKTLLLVINDAIQSIIEANKVEKEELAKCEGEKTFIEAQIEERRAIHLQERDNSLDILYQERRRLKSLIEEHNRRWRPEIEKYNEEIRIMQEQIKSFAEGTTEYGIFKNEIEIRESRIIDIGKLISALVREISLSHQEEDNIINITNQKIEPEKEVLKEQVDLLKKRQREVDEKLQINKEKLVLLQQLRTLS